MAGVHSWLLQLTSVAEVLVVYFCLACSESGDPPWRLTLTAHSTPVDEDPLSLCHFCHFWPWLSMLVLMLQAHLSRPSSLQEVCGFAKQHPCQMKTGKAQTGRPIPSSTWISHSTLWICKTLYIVSGSVVFIQNKSPCALTVISVCPLALHTLWGSEDPERRRYLSEFIAPSSSFHNSLALNGQTFPWSPFLLYIT